MENKWNERIDQFIQAQRENILRDIGRLVAVPSVEGPAAPGAPFGPGPRAALDEALAIAAELGLAPGEGEGHIGWADVPGAEKEKYLATITHLDVVPEGNGWDADPFTLRVRDGWLLGRGVADDKGPSVLCLYALKFLKDEAGPGAGTAGLQRRDEHEGRGVVQRPRKAPGVLLYAGCGVPAVQRREGPV